MINLINEIIKEFRNRVQLIQYNPFTIEKYFQRKGYAVGNNNRIFIQKLGGEPYLVKIGNHCTITEGVKFITHDGGAWVFREEISDLNVFGKIEIKDNCFIGVNSIILPNVRIGPDSVVGAGSVVTKDVPANTVVAGIPAQKLCSIEEYKEKCVKRWKALNLQGPRETWEKQLKDYFWNNKKNRKI